MENEFIPRMQQLSDVELLRIIEIRQYYKPLEGEAAVFVAKERNIINDNLKPNKNTLKQHKINGEFQPKLKIGKEEDNLYEPLIKQIYSYKLEVYYLYHPLYR